MELTNERKWTLLLGYLLLAVFVLLYIIELQMIPDRKGDDFTIFFIHYFISIGYLVNVTAADQKQMIENTKMILTNECFRINSENK